jgi:hypothetical protein
MCVQKKTKQQPKPKTKCPKCKRDIHKMKGSEVVTEGDCQYCLWKEQHKLTRQTVVKFRWANGGYRTCIYTLFIIVHKYMIKSHSLVEFNFAKVRIVHHELYTAISDDIINLFVLHFKELSVVIALHFNGWWMSLRTADACLYTDVNVHWLDWLSSFYMFL